MLFINLLCFSLCIKCVQFYIGYKDKFVKKFFKRIFSSFTELRIGNFSISKLLGKLYAARFLRIMYYKKSAAAEILRWLRLLIGGTSPVKGRRLFPLYSGRRFRRYIKDNPIYPFYLVYNSVGYFPQQIVWDMRPISSHSILASTTRKAITLS